jgi:hypothetical protein
MFTLPSTLSCSPLIFSQGKEPVKPYASLLCAGWVAVSLPVIAAASAQHEIQLVKLGVDFARGEIWKPFTVVDRNLYTGQNIGLSSAAGQGAAQSPELVAGNGVSRFCVRRPVCRTALRALLVS